MSTTLSPRDIDIRIASEVSSLVQTEHDFFVLTGSYSIDALTGANVTHNDIDANIFTTDIPTALGRIATIVRTRVADMELTQQTGNRLEYLRHHPEGVAPIEMQFVEYNGLAQRHVGLDFILPHTRDHDVVIPTVGAKLRESDGREHIFLVKSLPFAIGTWALRISGVALDQKRAVRESDIKHFAFLVAIPHDRTETLHAMQHHPQMPDNQRADDILDMSYEILMRTREG